VREFTRWLSVTPMTTPTDCANLSTSPRKRSPRPASSLHTTQQTRFETEGVAIEAPPIATTLIKYGLQIDCPIPQRRLAIPTSEAFVDDRPDLRADTLVSRQQMLFPSTDPNQRTLEDKPASLRFLF
jgi:hypothetical protein